MEESRKKHIKMITAGGKGNKEWLLKSMGLGGVGNENVLN